MCNFIDDVRWPFECLFGCQGQKTMGDDEFINVNRIIEGQLQAADVVAIAMSYPYLAVVRSANEMLVYKVDKREVLPMKRKSVVSGVSIVCADIHKEAGYVVTAGIGQAGGEIVVWQLSTASELVVMNLPFGVTHIQFGNSASEIVYADIHGRVSVLSLSNFFIKFQLKPKAKFEREMGVVVGMKMFKGSLYVGAQTGTFRLDLTKEGLPATEIDKNQTYCFGFYSSEEKLVMARSIGHNVVISQLTPPGEDRILEFDETPSQVAVINPNMVVVLFPERVEMASPKLRCRKEVPTGLSLEGNGAIYIVGKGIYEVNIVSQEQRIQYYIAREQWDMAFEQISSPDEVPDLYGILNSYIRSDNFESSVLFDLLERMDVTDYVVLGMLKEKREQLLVDYVASGRTGWLLTLDFVKEILNTLKDDEQITNFLESIELNQSWIKVIVCQCLERGLFDLANYLVATYRHDYYIQFLVALYRQDSKMLHATVHPLLKDCTSDPDLFTDTLAFMENYDLTQMFAFDEKHTDALLKAMLSYLNEKEMDTTNLIASVARAANKESQIWLTIAEHVSEKQLTVDSSVIPFIENFLFFRENEAGELQTSLFLMMLATHQFNDLRKYLNLARMKKYVECETWIVCQLHSYDEMVKSIISNQLAIFKDFLLNVVEDRTKVKSLLMSQSLLFISINADEFCELVSDLCSMEDVRKIGEALSGDAAAIWQFYKRILTQKVFAQEATGEEVVDFVKMLCRYRKEDVLSNLRNFKEFPTAKVLSVCEKNGIVDATLYLCDLMRDFARAKTFARDALTSALMKDQGQKVVTQICHYLSTTCCEDGKVQMWLDVMESFQLPFFAFRDDPEKTSHVAQLLSQYMDSMIRDVNDPVEVAQRFGKDFAFLPFRTARSILAGFFQSVREKFEFSRTLNRILKYEAVQKQMTRIKDLTGGRVYDAVRCTGCNRRLGQGNAIASHCGHVFHQECARNGWCPICQTSFASFVAKQPRQTRAPTHMWNQPTPKPKIVEKPMEPPRLGQVSVV